MTRSGQTLPVVGVSLLVLFASALVYHQVALSSYGQSHVVMDRTVAQLLTDLAGDELTVQMETATGCPGASLPEWADAVTRAVEARIGAAPDRVDQVNANVELDLSARLPVTARAGRDARTRVTVKLTAGPFESVPVGLDRARYYAEPLFGDATKDLVPAHLRGPLVLEMRTARPRGGDQVEVRRLEIALTDPTPPAAEFAYASFLPPGSEEDAVNELSRGGRLTVYPRESGRILFRGPYLVVPEDGVAPESKSFLGGDRPVASLSYPDRRWSGWSAIPGPRALINPPFDLSTIIHTVLKFVAKIIPGIPVPGVPDPVRPEIEHSRAHQLGPIDLPDLPVVPDDLGPWQLPEVSVVVGAGLGGNPGVTPGVWWPLFDDPMARYASGTYLHGLTPAGRQTFSIMGGTPAAGAAPGAPTREDLFRGVLVGPGGELRVYDGGATPGDEATGSVITCEPVPRAVGSGPADRGLIGAWGVSRFTSQTFFGVGLIELISWFIPGWNIASLPVRRILGAVGLSPEITLVFRRWEVDGTPPLPERVAPDAIARLIDRDDLIVAPYGLWFDPHEPLEGDRLQSAVIDLGIGAAVSLGTVVGWPWLKGLLFRKLGSKVASGAREITDVLPGAKKATDGVKKITEVSLKPVRGLSMSVAEHGLRAALAEFFEKGLGYLVKRVYKKIFGVWWGKHVHLWSRVINAVFGSYGPGPMPKPWSVAVATALVGFDSTKAEFPFGLLPSKVTDYQSIATRWYPDMRAMLARESVEGVLVLSGIVLVADASYAGETIRYRGRGMVVLVSSDPARAVTLDCNVEPASEGDGSWLTLVHQVPARVLENGPLVPLKLGERVVASVYSDSGVAPARAGTVIQGNLVVATPNKRAIPAELSGADQGVHVVYAPHLAAFARRRMPYTLSVVRDRPITGRERR